MNLRGRKVLVTGAGGFIGSHLVEALVGEGARVRALVHYNSRNDPGMLSHVPGEVFDEIEVVAGDLRDQSAINEVVNGCELVFHLGALISIPYSYRNPYEVAETNLMGTLNVLQACRNHDIARLIQTSSSEVYGTAQKVPMDEGHPLQGQSPYSASKIGADKLAESFHLSYELPVVTLRPFNTYGPRQSARAVIPTTIIQALTRDKVELGNLDARRDLTFISDTVKGFINVAETEGIEGETFNLGTGREIKINDLAKMIISLVDRNVDLHVDPKRLRPESSEVMRLVADYSKASSQLGWQPKIELEEGLRRTIAWMKLNIDRYRPNTYLF